MGRKCQSRQKSYEESPSDSRRGYYFEKVIVKSSDDLLWGWKKCCVVEKVQRRVLYGFYVTIGGVIRLIGQPDWKYQDTVVKIIQITGKNEDERNVDAFDLEISMPIRADVLEDSVMQNIKVGKKYRATMKAYNAEITPQLDNMLAEVENQQPLLHDFIKNLKKFDGGKPLYRFELIKIEPT